MVERTRLQNLLLIFRAFFLGEFFSRKVTPEITSEIIFKRRKNTLNSNTKSYSEINCLPDPNHEETVPFQKQTLAQQTPLIIQTPHLDLPEPDSTNLTQNSSKLQPSLPVQSTKTPNSTSCFLSRSKNLSLTISNCCKTQSFLNLGISPNTFRLCQQD